MPNAMNPRPPEPKNGLNRLEMKSVWRSRSVIERHEGEGARARAASARGGPASRAASPAKSSTHQTSARFPGPAAARISSGRPSAERRPFRSSRPRMPRNSAPACCPRRASQDRRRRARRRSTTTCRSHWASSRADLPDHLEHQRPGAAAAAGRTARRPPAPAPGRRGPPPAPAVMVYDSTSGSASRVAVLSIVSRSGRDSVGGASARTASHASPTRASEPSPPASAATWTSSGPSASQPAASPSVSQSRQPSSTGQQHPRHPARQPLLGDRGDPAGRLGRERGHVHARPAAAAA